MDNDREQNAMLVITVIAVLAIGAIFIITRSGKKTIIPKIVPTIVQQEMSNTPKPTKLPK